MNRDVTFTFEWYDDFLRRLQEHDRRFRTYDDELSDGDVLLRHDVDWSPRRALRTARLEADRGVQSNYFFLVSSPLYNAVHKPTRRIIQRIEALGHEVGLHFSPHQYWNGEPPESELIERVQAEQRILAAVASDPMETVSFHRPHEWMFGRTFGDLDSTYGERYFSEIAYRADSNQRWRDEPPLADGVPDRLQVLMHPGLWGEEDGSFTERLTAILDRRLRRTREFTNDQFVGKKYNIDEFCEFDTVEAE